MRLARSVALLALALCMCAGLVGVGSPATADTPRCVTHHEWRRVDIGWTMHRVVGVLDIRGIRTDGWKTPSGEQVEVRDFRKCGSRGNPYAHMFLNRYSKADPWRLKYRGW